MRRKASLLAAFAVVALALAPGLADARRGGGFSSGSRGARTYQAPPATRTAPTQAQPFQRTQSAPAVAGATAGAAGAAAATRSSGLRSGLMGGLLGAGLFGLLLGGGLFGGLGSLSAIFGLLLQVALIGGVIWLVMRFMRSRRPATAAGPQNYAREMPGAPGPRPMTGGLGAARAGALGAGAMGAGAAAASRPLEITAADYDAFERNLVEVNEAWSRQDLEALRRLSTPEMTNYFAQDLKDLRGRGWTNVTSGTRLEAGDLSEAWTENGQDFATVAMRYSIVDVTTDASGKVVEGHPSDRQTVTEILTYTRFQGEPWRLSAIQQTA